MESQLTVNWWTSHGLTLINSILGSLPPYHFSVFRAPLGVVKKIETLRNKFFWGATGGDKKIIWAKIQKLFGDSEFGGLKVGSLIAKNLVVLQKWKCKWLTEPHSLWTRIVASINGEVPGSTWMGRRADRWSVWTDICRASGEIDSLGHDFTNLITKEVLSGNKTRFWEDDWIGGCSLKDKFTRLYDLELNKGCRVIQKIRWSENQWSWVWSWRRNLRGRAEGQLPELTHLLQEFIPQQEQADTWRWNPAADGTFTVCSLSKRITAHLHLV